MAVNLDLAKIVCAAVHPAIGIARVGNSVADFYVGPELTNPPAASPGAHRDSTGALKRQAARFRIYGYDAEGTVVVELTAAEAEIHWMVELANLKAAWYQFQIALDLPEAGIADPALRRNADVQDRSRLAIRGGTRHIRGSSQSGPQFFFGDGAFQGIGVSLGALQTDESGRLLVLGGHGVSASVGHIPPTTFANNDGWYDDTADGPVTAIVTIAGRPIPVEPAWVVTAPPDYAPNLKSVRTMFDLLTDLFSQAGWLSPAPVTFTGDIQPILERMAGLQWTNAGFAAAFGHGARLDFGNPTTLAACAAMLPPGHTGHEARRQFANAFRVFGRDGSSPTPMPWLYGDAVTGAHPLPAHEYAALTGTQLAAFQAWARGDFTAGTPTLQYATLAEVPLAAQPAMLDRAALEFCLADAFHPGCELTWPMRHLGLYSAPYRIRHALSHPSPGPAPDAGPDYGNTLTPSAALAPDGPLNAQSAGGLTRWMAVPWQTDTASCRSGYRPEYDPYLPTFWPARVPNHVLDWPAYQAAIDTAQPRADRIAAFHTRTSWPDALPGATQEDQVANMVTLFGAMGIAEAMPGVPDDPDLPATMQVTRLPIFPKPAPAGLALAQVRVPGHTAPSRDGSFMGRFPRLRRSPPNEP